MSILYYVWGQSHNGCPFLFKLPTLQPPSIPSSLLFHSSFFIFWGVPLAASGFGSGYPLILAAYKGLVLSLCSSLSVIRNS